MFAVKGLYDGVAIKPKEDIPFSEEYEVVITFLKPKDKIAEEAESKPNDIAERLAIVDSLIGILPSTVTDEEVKEARLKRYERGY